MSSDNKDTSTHQDFFHSNYNWEAKASVGLNVKLRQTAIKNYL